MELLDLGEDLLRVRQLPPAILLDEADLPLPVHDEGRPGVGVHVGPVDPVLLHDLSVNVPQQGVTDPTQRPYPPVSPPAGTRPRSCAPARAPRGPDGAPRAAPRARPGAPPRSRPSRSRRRAQAS